MLLAILDKGLETAASGQGTLQTRRITESYVLFWKQWEEVFMIDSSAPEKDAQAIGQLYSTVL